MKIYEVRDISDEETYWTKIIFDNLEDAKKCINERIQEICEESIENSDFGKAAVYEWEVGFWTPPKRVYEKDHQRKYDPETGEALKP